MVNYSGWLNTENGDPASVFHTGEANLADVGWSKAHYYGAGETVYIEVSDICDADPLIEADIDGVEVFDGDLVRVKIKHRHFGWKVKHGVVHIAAQPGSQLTVTVTDTSDNSTTCTAALPTKVKHPKH